MLVDTAESKFHVGEKWSYHARQGEERSSLTIVKVESSPKLGVIVHMSLDGLRIKSAHGHQGGGAGQHSEHQLPETPVSRRARSG